MLKRVLIYCVVVFILGIPANQTRAMVEVFPNRPELPRESAEEEISSVIVTKEQDLDSLLSKIDKVYPDVEINHIYHHVFNGFSVKGKRKFIQQIEKEEGVIHGSPVTTYKVSLDKSVPFIGGDAVRGYFDIKDHRLTGEGIKVGVIDTGIDYTHPDLTENYSGGFDIVDGDSDPMETKGSVQTQTIHGTHVAGIIAANGKFKGVAPKAKVIAYRALGPGGVGTSEQVIAAIDKAIEDKVDIINLSLGNTVNGPDWPTSLALDKAADKGIIAVTSSGNSGPEVWTVGSPGTSSKAISVGASTPPIQVPILNMGNDNKEIEIAPMQGSKLWEFKRTLPIITAGIGKKNQVKNVKDKLVLIQRGEIPFYEKALNAEKAGAKGVLIYNNEEGNFAGSLELELNIPVASISKEDGEWLIKQLKKKQNMITTSFKTVEDTLASFSSRGPVTSTWEIKPDVVAPGVEINSTIPHGYTELQGTSMAAPHVAGAAALVKQAHPDWTPEQVKAALMNTAKLLRDEKGAVYKPYEQGAGRIQVIEAIKAETLIYPSSFSLGMYHHQDERTEKTITFTVDNQSNHEKHYTFDVPHFRNGLQWKLPTSFNVNPQSKKEISVTLDITPNVVGKGIHDGQLIIHEGNNEVRLPYLFVIEEPDYPRVMAFQFGKGDKPSTYKYQLYLPGGADEYGIALYDPDTFRFIKFLDWRKDVTRGLIERELTAEEIGEHGIYKTLIFAKKADKEDTIEADILIE